MTLDHDEALVQSRVKALLDESIKTMDVYTIARLHKARRVALAAGVKDRRALFPLASWPVAAGGVATLGAALLGSVLWFSSGPAGGPGAIISVVAAAGPEDTEILANGDSLDFYENLDFYQWLAKKNSLGSAG